MGMLTHSNFRFWISDFGMNKDATIQNPNSKIQNKVVEVNPAAAGMASLLDKRKPSPDIHLHQIILF
jgi:hypothetical protein